MYGTVLNCAVVGVLNYDTIQMSGDCWIDGVTLSDNAPAESSLVTHVNPVKRRGSQSLKYNVIIHELNPRPTSGCPLTRRRPPWQQLSTQVHHPYK